jgi:hypothetical protein
MNDSIQSGKGKGRRVIVVLCGLLAVGTLLVHQWRVIGQLRRENLAARLAINELQQTASTSAEQQTAAAGEPSVSASPDDPERVLKAKEKTELLRLRNEVRQLRERVAPTQANALPQPGAPQQPVAIADHGEFAQASLNPIWRTELTSEWRGMEQFATNKYAQALERLDHAGHYIERFHALGDVAKMNFTFGKADDARAVATEMLALAERYKSEVWGKDGCGQAVHDGNLVLGRVALEQGAIEDAMRYLLEAGTSSGSPVLGSFGPNMSLARDLLERGERDTVLQYFERCGRFWQVDTLKQWSDEVTAGRIPNFGANLIY